MYISKITQRGQATIPAAVRANLKLHSGDSVAFDIQDDGTIIIKKAKPLDVAYLQSLDASLSEEWHSKEDSEAFDDLL